MAVESFTVFDAAGVAVAGDVIVDDLMRREADQVGGWIEDAAGVRVYPS